MSLAGLWATLLRHRAARGLVLLVKNLDVHHGPLAASAIAFDTFLSLIPLVAIAGAILARLHKASELVMGPIARAAPGPVRELVIEEFERIGAADMAALAPVSIVAFIWVSSSGLSTAMYVFENMFHSRPRSWWWRRLIAMGTVIAGVAGLVVVIALTVWLAGLSGSVGTRAVAFAVPLGLLVGLLVCFFRIAIRGPRPLRRRSLPGALMTVALWTTTSAAFSFYVSTLSRYTTLYGRLAAVAIFLFWLWLLALALLVGGEVNAQLEGVRVDPEEAARETAAIAAEAVARAAEAAAIARASQPDRGRASDGTR